MPLRLCIRRLRLCRRALILCEEIGLWGTAHTDGTVELRLLPTGDPDERFTLELEPGKPVPSVNIPQFRAPFCVCPSWLRSCILNNGLVLMAALVLRASDRTIIIRSPMQLGECFNHAAGRSTLHVLCGTRQVCDIVAAVKAIGSEPTRMTVQAHRGGLLHAVGCGATMVTAGRFGAVTLWPEAELRSIAEGAGFVLPTRAPPGVEPSGAVTRQATISQVCLLSRVALACDTSLVHMRMLRF